MKPPALLSLAVLSAVVMSTAAARPLALVKDGQPSATIIIATNATRAAQFAAFELQWHIQAISGATLPIRRGDAAVPQGQVKLYVGDGPQTQALGLTQRAFRPQEYAVRFGANEVVLVGKDAADSADVKYDLTALNNGAKNANWPGLWDERGTLDACYDFLERECGVRWFNPTDFGTVLPHMTTVTVTGRAVRRSPDFRYRDATGAVGNIPELYDEYTALWPAATPEFKAWEAAAYPRLHATYGASGAYIPAKRAHIRLFQLRHHEGGDMARCNHSFYGYYDRFWEKNPANPSAFVAQHPEYFAQGYPGKPPQLCYTSPALVQQVAQDAGEYFDGKKTGAQLGVFWNPTLPNPFPIEPMDNGSFCKCDRCRAWLKRAPAASPFFANGRDSDYFFQFVNAVARAVQKTQPTNRLITLAYMTHTAPPSFKLEPNVIVEFCFAANRAPCSAEYTHEMDLLRQWAQRKNPLDMWLYDTFPVELANGGKFHCWPGFFAHALGRQMKLFHQLGVRGFFHCGYGQDVEAYLTYRLMDDVSLDVDTLLNDYFTRLYGPAGKPLHEFYDLVEQAYCDPANYPKGAGGETMMIAWQNLGTTERMAKLSQLIDEAKALAVTDLQKQRVALFEKGVWSYMVAGRNQYLERIGAPIPAVAVPRTTADQPDWRKAVTLGAWHAQNSGQPAARPLTARALHDDKFLYLELADPCDTTKLQTAATVFPDDDWELFVAAQRALPYRQFAVSPKGQLAAFSNGEVNWRMNVPITGAGIRVESDRSAKDKWVTRWTIPLASLTAQGVPAAGKFYLNLARVSSPQVTGSGMGIDTWVAFSRLHDVDRLAAITLAK